MGVGIYIGAQHLWFWHKGRRARSHLWVVAFCVSVVLFLAGRYMEVSAESPDAGVYAGRFQVAMTPFMIYSLVGFGRSLAERAWHRSSMLALLGLSATLSAIAYSTALMIADAPFVDTDWFGHDHYSAPGTLYMLFLLAYAIPAYVLVFRDVRSAPDLHPHERNVLGFTLAIFTIMGGLSILSAIEWVQIPLLIQFGLVVIACGLSYLLVAEHQRLQDKLERMVEERTEELQGSEAAYRRLVEHAPLGILACASDGRLLAINPHMIRMVGGPVDESTKRGIGDYTANVFERQPVIESGMVSMLKECAETGRPAQGEFSFRSHWGVDLELRLHVAPIRDASGEVRAIQVIAEDMGDRKALEERLRQSQKMEEVGRLAAGIAHEINNPMSYVRANLSMLRGEWSGLRAEIGKRGLPDSLESAMADCEELIDESMEGVERTVALVRDVKEFSHSRSGRREKAALNDILEDSLRMASHRIAAGVRIERDYAELPPLICSTPQLRQVFNNLLDNALHAVGPRGTIRVVTRREGDEAVARIEDDGPGIAAEAVEQIFDPFFTTKEAGEGTGLGLYIAYEIARIHEGSIHLDSKPGAGARFEVRLPLPAKDECADAG
jgi:PAS domain S-box-containing protein